MIFVLTSVVVSLTVAMVQLIARAGGSGLSVAVNERLLRVFPHHKAVILLSLASLYERKRQWQRALTVLRTARAQAADTVAIDLEIARVLDQSGNQDSARELYKRILDENPDLSEAFKIAVRRRMDVV